MLNTSDDVVLEFKYSGATVEIHNRNLESTEGNMVGYRKTISTEGLMQLEDGYIVDQRGETKLSYDLEFDFIFNSSELENFLNLVLNSNEGYRQRLKNSIRVFDIPDPTTVGKKLELVDNRVKDFLSGNFETYEILITDISEINTQAMEIHKLNVRGETL